MVSRSKVSDAMNSLIIWKHKDHTVDRADLIHSADVMLQFSLRRWLIPIHLTCWHNHCVIANSKCYNKVLEAKPHIKGALWTKLATFSGSCTYKTCITETIPYPLADLLLAHYQCSTDVFKYHSSLSTYVLTRLNTAYVYITHRLKLVRILK